MEDFVRPAFVTPASLPLSGLSAAAPAVDPRKAQRRSRPHGVAMQMDRRAVLRGLAALPTGLLLGSTAMPADTHGVAIRSGEMHAELSELASKIPGAGMPDVYYPDFFLGDWVVTRELYAVEMLSAPSSAQKSPDWLRAHTTLSEEGVDLARSDIGRRQTYRMRFVTHRGHVIEDRLYNVREETLANARGADRTAAALRVRPAAGQRVDVTWDADNANVTSISWDALAIPGTAVGTGRRVVREAKVTKRSFVDGPQGYGTFVASEYARVVDFDGEGALLGFGRPPSIYGRRRIVRYKVSSVNERFEPDGMDRITVEYLYAPSAGDGKAAVLLKYRDFLNRVSRLSELVGG